MANVFRLSLDIPIEVWEEIEKQIGEGQSKSNYVVEVLREKVEQDKIKGGIKHE